MSWCKTTVSSDGTHHEIAGQPIYEQRFDEVLKFHAPGLAPVRRAYEAWHIHVNGQSAYLQRFRRAFGYYEGCAAVVSDSGWHHICIDGTSLYSERYAWCGNFQGGRCTVRQLDGLYFHITELGKAAYDGRWRYAGDYRDGICVVQDGSGRSTHLDIAGKLIHGCWFIDLDVFHKGFARARDEDGWVHVDSTGKPAYSRRFATVEPFYNGQARVERFDGGLEVIDEYGNRQAELRPALRNEFAALSSDLVGFWKTQTICAAVETGIFEALPATADSVASICNLVPDRALRLLRALAELQLIEREGVQWETTERGRFLRSSHPLTLADAAIEYGRHFPAMWETLPQALQRNGNWTRTDIFLKVSENKDRVAPHHRMLQSYARNDYAEVPVALGLKGNEHVVDAGGGLGVLAYMLIDHYPNLEVTLLERPEVIGRIKAQMIPKGVNTMAGDIFGAWGAVCDVVVMSRILHDWDDADAIRILRRAREALPLNGRLFVVEMVVPEDGVSGSVCDLHLLMATGGKERTLKEYAALMEQSGFWLVEIKHLVALPFVLEGVAI